MRNPTVTATRKSDDIAVNGRPATRPATILVADGLEADRLFLRNILDGEPYCVLEAPNTLDVLRVLNQRLVDLVILSSAGPESRGLECCRQIKADHKTELIPVLVMTGDQNIGGQIDALSAGADDLLSHLMHADLARTRIHALLRQKAATDRLEQTETILFALAQAVEQRDRTTSGHCERLSLYSLALGIALGLPQDDLEALYRGGVLHDIGKVSMPDSILFKPGPLDDQEWQTMRTHPERGEEICRGLHSLDRVLPIIRNHHEKWDGSGYPDGLRGDEIPLLARVLQFSDIYDALISVRPYKPALPPETALEIMQEETDRGWRDPEMMKLFKQLPQNHIWQEAREMQTSLHNLQSHLMEA